MSKKLGCKNNKPTQNANIEYDNFIKQSAGELANILRFWQLNTIDSSYGGFYGRRDHFNRLIPKAQKGIILNTRILWSFSAAGNFYSNTKYLEICERAFSYLKDKFKDEEYGGVYWMVDYKGFPSITRKQTYAQAFTIYSLSEYYKYSRNRVALDWAMEIFYHLEKIALDTNSGGYIESFKRDWQPIEDMRLSEKDLNASKTMNTHLHILEAYTTLFEVSGNEKVGCALENLILLILKRFLTEDYHFRLFFSNDWNSLSTEVSYGHDIEAAWLLVNSARKLGNKDLILSTETRAISIADTFVTIALDEDFGVYNNIDVQNMKIDTDKHWWPQAEAIVGLLYVWKITGINKYFTIALKIWNFIDLAIIDKINGEWVFRVNKDGVPYEDENKVGPWKCPYHNSRACMEILRLLKQPGLN
jgi:mannobiose 2-epimerase